MGLFVAPPSPPSPWLVGLGGRFGFGLLLGQPHHAELGQIVLPRAADAAGGEEAAGEAAAGREVQHPAEGEERAGRDGGDAAGVGATPAEGDLGALGDQRAGARESHSAIPRGDQSDHPQHLRR